MTTQVARDMTQKQFDAACARHGFLKQGFLGYYVVSQNPRRLVSIHNAGSRRRDQLAYLLRETERPSDG